MPERGTVENGITYGSKDSSLRSESPTNQPAQSADQARSVAPANADGGEVGGQIPKKPAAPDGVSQAEWALIEECLPTPMRVGFTVQAGARITAALHQAQAVGWRPGQIQRALNGNPLPPDMASPTGLVIHRVEALAATPAPQPRTATPAPVEPVREPLSVDELRAAAEVWRTSTFGTPEFRARRLTETLAQLAEVDVCDRPVAGSRARKA